MANLTPKQDAFCLAYMETGNASEAYRRSYNAGGMKPESVWRKANELMDNVKVAARIADLSEKIEAKALVTIERLTNDLLRIAQKGEDLAEAPGLSVARASLMDAAKLNGLVVDKNEHTGKDGAAIKLEQVKNDAQSFTSSIIGLAARSGATS